MRPLIEYMDFRKYLRDFIDERKSRGLPCSNRWFSMKLQINSSSWLTSVLKGKKGISRETARKLSGILKHTPVESKYFEALVSFNQARTISERTQHFQELSGLRKLGGIVKTTVRQYDFYSTWYHSVVWSLIGMYKFRSSQKDLERLADMISPPITISQPRKSVRLLEELGFIRISEDGYYRQSSSAITTGEEIRSLAVANYQQETMRLAQESMDRYSRDERYIGTVTVGVSEKAFKLIKQLLVDVSDRISEIANADDNSDRVYQINLQAFPLSKFENNQTTYQERE